MVQMLEKQDIILRYVRDGESIRHISRATGISRRTVRKYVTEYEAHKQALNDGSTSSSSELIEQFVESPSYNSSTRTKRTLTTELVERVRRCLAENEQKRSRGQHKQQLKKIDIHELLRAEGYDISYSSVCLLVKNLEQRTPKSFIKQVYEDGRVCEFDWGEVKIFLAGVLKKIQMAVFTTAKGNYRSARLFVKQDTSSFQQAHALFFAHVGGVYRERVYDNMRVAVKRVVGPSEKEATSGLLSVSLYDQFGFRFCNVRRGNEKGHVERSVEYVRRKAFAPRDRFETLEQANAYLAEMCDGLNERPLTGEESSQSAREILDRERSALLPVGPPFECGELRESRVDTYSTICIDTCHYSVPEEYVGQLVNVRVYPDRLVCFAGGRRLCEHSRHHGFHEWHLNIAHDLRGLQRKPGALAGSVALKQSGQRIQAMYQQDYQDNPKNFIELLLYMNTEQKALDEIEQAIRRLHASGSLAIDTDKITLVCANARRTEPVRDESGEIARSALTQLSLFVEFVPEHTTLQGEVLR
ncbi:MAG: IS21 family transposase [bacterium]|nr:IS21 family transposase [bacterium]